MSHGLTKIFLSAALMGCLATGCATVDLNEMATPAAEKSNVEFNVVQRAVSKMKSAFTNKGFVAKTSRKRMQSAAKILLNGLEDKQVTSASDNSYAASNNPVSVVLADMSFAKQHVMQTTKAAEVYLEMAPAERSLRDELSSLEAALMAAKEAGRVFETALGGADVAALISYEDTVSALRRVTDEFGARVRTQQSEKLAMRATAS